MSPPDRAAVERLIADLVEGLVSQQAMPDSSWEGKLEIVQRHVRDLRSDLDAQARDSVRLADECRNILQRLELAEQEKAEAVAQRDAEWRGWGVIEVAVRNQSVSDYMNHWEGRALRSEARTEQLRAALDAVTEIGCKFGCDAESSCDCPAHRERHRRLSGDGA